MKPVESRVVQGRKGKASKKAGSFRLRHLQAKREQQKKAKMLDGSGTGYFLKVVIERAKAQASH